MFSLDYQTISRTLQSMRYTGFVKATIPSGKLAGGTVFLKVQSGMVQVRVVTTSDGQQVNDAKLITEQLTRCGLLEWHLSTLPDASQDATTPAKSLFTPEETKARPHIPPEQTELSPTSYPRHLAADPAWVRTWPFIHRQVYNIATGQYSEQDIARLLHHPPAELLKVFRDLESMEVLLRGI